MEPLIRLHFDEHVSPAVVVGLRTRGVDVTTTPEEGLLSAADEEQLAFAVRERRVIFTQDTDFLRFSAAGHEHRGIIYAPQGTPIGPIVRDLLLICFVMSEEELANQVVYVPL
ncbi:MAG: DUF5615 family PIN-like protein [Planctomycetaceae bacterium]